MRVALVGAGPMGRLHARTLSRMADRGVDVCLSQILDRHPGRAAELAEEYGGAVAGDLALLEGCVDAAIVAVPTASHYEVARQLLDLDLDLLVEKPFTSDVDEGQSLVERARAQGRILQVGHVEWYNPAWRAAATRVGRLRRIEVDRFQPPSERGRDIDVIQDLMLHDLDWTSRLINKKIANIEAVGHCDQQGRLEAVEAEIRFEGEGVVQLRASRLHAERRREASLEGSEGRVVVDLDARQDLHQDDRDLHQDEGKAGRSVTVSEDSPAASASDPLESQWADFMSASQSRQQPANHGSVGVDALRLVDRVRSSIDSPAGGSSLDDNSRFSG